MTKTTNITFPAITQGVIGTEQIQTVNARDLHAFLEVGKDFSNWIKDRIETYNFVENQDFIFLAEIGEKSGRGRPAKEYAISIDMAKELAMVERNEKGKQARQYFIECERQLKNPNRAIKSQTPAMVREARLQFKMLEGIAKQMGLQGNQAILSATIGTKVLTGVDMLGAMQITHMNAANNNPDLTPTAIASRLGFKSAREVNNLLVVYGYQEMFRDHKRNVYYELTSKGKACGGIYKDTAKKHSDGTPVKQLLWGADVIEHLRSDINGDEAA